MKACCFVLFLLNGWMIGAVIELVVSSKRGRHSSSKHIFSSQLSSLQNLEYGGVLLFEASH